ncbi:hypothetical protein CVT26_007949 [Gymnopilus dilepis]|uniref:Uncharacterized protein n=1 Tax=Gymnopilus dilepis TaxID=231916 RepID=A0A409WEL5_9AGAR|nr:hypothetical protein CVT26_007949 [Gymnopilus dilepis]
MYRRDQPDLGSVGQMADMHTLLDPLNGINERLEERALPRHPLSAPDPSPPPPQEFKQLEPQESWRYNLPPRLSLKNWKGHRVVQSTSLPQGSDGT